MLEEQPIDTQILKKNYTKAIVVHTRLANGCVVVFEDDPFYYNLVENIESVLYHILKYCHS
jgi:hypothetical protein